MNTGSNPVGVADSNTARTKQSGAEKEQTSSALARTWPMVGGREFPGKGVEVEIRNYAAGGWEERSVRRRSWVGQEATFRVVGDDYQAREVAYPASTFGEWWRWPMSSAPETVEVYGGTVTGWVSKRVRPPRGAEKYPVALHEDGGDSIALEPGDEGRIWRRPTSSAQAPEAPREVRTCLGIPGCGPAVQCDAILGLDNPHDRCAPCREWMQAHGQCDGCMSHRVRDWKVTGLLCADCRRYRMVELEREAKNAIVERERQAREAIADAASGRAESVIFPPAGDVGAIGLRSTDAGVTLAIYDREGVAEMRPLVQGTLALDVVEFLRGEFARLYADQLSREGKRGGAQ